jgi:hypothetical protein
VVNRHVRDSLSHVAAGHNLTGHAAAGPGSPIYDHALSSGVTTALAMGAAATVLALIVTVVAIRVRREDLPDSTLVSCARSLSVKSRLAEWRGRDGPRPS